MNMLIFRAEKFLKLLLILHHQMCQKAMVNLIINNGKIQIFTHPVA